MSATTVRRLYVDEGLDRLSMRASDGGKTRLCWQAERPGALWHGDVCHGPTLRVDGKSYPLRIHGMLDDASRYVVALEAHHQEREVDMLGVFVRALRRHGPPDALYLDNGATLWVVAEIRMNVVGGRESKVQSENGAEVVDQRNGLGPPPPGLEHLFCRHLRHRQGDRLRLELPIGVESVIGMRGIRT